MTLANLKDRVLSFVSPSRFDYSALPGDGGRRPADEEAYRRGAADKTWAGRHRSLIRVTGVALVLALVGTFAINSACVFIIYLLVYFN